MSLFEFVSCLLIESSLIIRPSHVRLPETDIDMATPSTELTWPPPNTQEQLFDLYFAHIHTLFPMVKSVSFASCIDTGVRKEQDEFLTLSIFATAGLYYGERKSELLDGAGNSYFSAAKQCIGASVYIVYVYSAISISIQARSLKCHLLLCVKV